LLIDYHMHTFATADGTASLLDMAEAAAGRGIFEIAITDHHVVFEPDYAVSLERIQQHALDAETALSRFGVNVRIGAEVDYTPDELDKVEHFIGSFDFDFILGISHYMYGLGLADLGDAERLFNGRNAVDCYRDFFALQVEVAQSKLFDVLAHADIIRKFGDRYLGPVPFEQYAEYAVTLADALKESGTGFEVNCRGYDHSPADAYPSVPLLNLFAERGIGPVTIGSDAHSVDIVGRYLDRGIERLRTAGFKSIHRFVRRKPIEIPI
jgi:histidinol-phosphatase (PHP family)